VQEDIHIVVALGTHRQMSQAEIVAKVGADVAADYEIVNIPSSTDSEMVYMGTSSNGIPAWVNRSVAEADVRIALGMISPHLVTGYNGGAKIILPGVCSTLTVDTFHAREADIPTNQLGNINAPLRRDLEQFVSERVPLNFIVNVITTPDGEIYQCVAGHFIQAHRTGVAYANEVFGTPVKRKYPVVIANCYPYQQDLWQSAKGLWCGELLTANRGMLVLVTQAEEGNSNYPLFPHYIGCDPDELKIRLDTNEVEDPKAAASGLLIGRMKQRINFALVSDGLTQADVDIMGISYYDTVEAAIEAEVARLPTSDRQGAVCVLTHAGIMLPLLQ
jgi:nickel-dependent lactate racemase